jgi:hypothetical protein
MSPHESHRHDAKRRYRIHQSIHPSVALAVELTAPGSAIPLVAALRDSIDTRQYRQSPPWERCPIRPMTAASGLPRVL